MKKYINSFSIHFALVVFMFCILLSIESATFLAYGAIILLLLFFLLTFYNRCKNMNEEEFIERLGFKGNKFFDFTLEE